MLQIVEIVNGQRGGKKKTSKSYTKKYLRKLS